MAAETGPGRNAVNLTQCTHIFPLGSSVTQHRRGGGGGGLEGYFGIRPSSLGLKPYILHVLATEVRGASICITISDSSG